MEPEAYERLRLLVEEQLPFNRLLGLRLDSAGNGRSRVRFDFAPELVGNYLHQMLHGGVISTVLDMVGACAVMTDPTFEFGQMAGTVDLRVDFLAPGTGAWFTADGVLMRGGRSLCTTRMELHNDAGLLVATGAAVYRLVREEA